MFAKYKMNDVDHNTYHRKGTSMNSDTTTDESPDEARDRALAEQLFGRVTKKPEDTEEESNDEKPKQGSN